MKEATGELNMTVIVVVAIVLVGALFTAFVYPMIKSGIANQTCKTYGEDYTARANGDSFDCCNSKNVCIPAMESKTTTK